MDLNQQQCVPCRGGVDPMPRDQAKAVLATLPRWHLSDDGRQIIRNIEFKNFAEALAFVDKVGAEAEAQGHHPDISFGWGYVKVTLWTHKIQGLHQNDFIMAARVDALLDAKS